MTFILTNDDGIDAPGILALKNALNGHRSITVAPQQGLSGCGHKVITDRPIHVDRRSDSAYAIGGTPADCTRIALANLSPDASWIVSGINYGGNMGVDVYISGTVAAVREGAIHGVPGIAISQYRKAGRLVDWDRTTKIARKVLTQLLDRPPEKGSFWNVNLPFVEANDPEPEVVFCQPSTQPLPVKYRIEGEYYYYEGVYGMRDRAPGTDVEVCFSGNIAVTQLHL
ncbi:5'/3'-nucleotidase SurE [Phormidium sp. CCY1219]|jgi:5'-nucleotidase|uniref:5'/3'-nucleotidase SurE n=1 Tax=Phormidium sp. CCY1219 TaxID=2886104 RepID=UPI002D1F72E2|nr:5'/3'-nucleotidase SurE [Phormidium sp. CCY1219]MEB3826317.1 5'/3'-nucleotidase SurE [Phormidium sp. CCY1219]